MKLRLFMTLGIFLAYAVLLFAACGTNNTSVSAIDEKTTNVPSEPNEANLPTNNVKISLLGHFFSNEDGCYWMIVGDSSFYELIFETVGPPTITDNTDVLVTGEYATRLGSNCGGEGPIITVESVEAIPEKANSEPETNANDF